MNQQICSVLEHICWAFQIVMFTALQFTHGSLDWDLYWKLTLLRKIWIFLNRQKQYWTHWSNDYLQLNQVLHLFTTLALKNKNIANFHLRDKLLLLTPRGFMESWQVFSVHPAFCSLLKKEKTELLERKMLWRSGIFFGNFVDTTKCFHLFIFL